MTRPALSLLLATALLAGCVSTENDQAVFSTGEPLDPSAITTSAPTYTQPDAPSLTGLDRSHWPRTDVSVPQRDSVHQPTYRSDPVQFAKASAVQRDEYPTDETAGESVTGDSGPAQSLEGIVMPLQAVADMFLMIPRAIFHSPIAPVRGPMIPVDRMPPGKAYPLGNPAPGNPPAAPTAPASAAPTTEPSTQEQPK
ncbi:MAG: hypothetical protein QM783_15610 [Phycisphaerales bacterium]